MTQNSHGDVSTTATTAREPTSAAQLRGQYIATASGRYGAIHVRLKDVYSKQSLDTISYDHNKRALVPTCAIR